MAFYQFGSVVFRPRLTGDTVPAVSAPAPIFSERHIPYSAVNIMDVGGYGPRRYAATIRLTPENVDPMMNKLLTTDTLIIQGESWTTATLVKLDNHQVTPMPRKGTVPPAWEPDYHFFDAEWVIGEIKVG